MKNEKAFTPEEVKKGLHKDLINYLLDYNTKSEKDTYDIHITTDGFCLIVEWCDRKLDDQFDDERFEFIDEEHVVMLSKYLPDDTIQLFTSKEEYKEALNEWIKENPTWKQNEYGRWYDTKVQEAWENEIKRQKEDNKGI